MSFSPTKVPESISPDIMHLCNKIAGRCDADYIDVINYLGNQRNKCTYNAKDEAEAVGGDVVLGWSIFIWGSVFVQFIGHAIVKTNERQYCVTPPKHGENKILFLPDASLVFDYNDENARLPSRTLPISKHKPVHRLIAVQRELYEIKSKYAVASGTIALVGEDALKVTALEKEEYDLINHAIYLHHPLKSKCACGSGKQFRKCCRPHMKRTFG